MIGLKNIGTKFLILLIAALTAMPVSSFSLGRNGKSPASSFAIFIDEASYRECMAEVESYKQTLEKEGLVTYLMAGVWETPEMVKKEIDKLASKKPALEGMVFIGDIPIVRIRKGQHLTTAFKMNEQTFPIEESSVTSDRFYDTPSLKFEYVGKDSTDSRRFYYNLLSTGAQVLLPAYYSGRILVPEELARSKGESRYEILRKYLKKVVEAHNEENYLDHIIYFAGHGYNSDCLTAWRQQPLAFRTYFPLAFEFSEGNKFLNFRQERAMKFTLFTQLQRNDTDLFMFYEHGAPDTQYINGDFPARSLDEYVQMLKYTIRSQYHRLEPVKREAFITDVCSHYGLDASEFTQEKIEAMAEADSTFSADRDISLVDLAGLNMTPRVTILNACYNGSFHLPGYVAGYHIFNDGRTVVTQGNSVNVLQDKWAEQLIGLLSMGARIGFWQKEVATLESHLIGDPTFRFDPYAAAHASLYGSENPPTEKANRALGLDILGGSDINEILAGTASGKLGKEYWKDLFDKGTSAPFTRALALKQLQKYYMTEGGEDFSDFAFKVFSEDENMVVRMQALQALSVCADSNFVAAIKLGLYDTYELIRRQSAHYAGKNGDPSLVEPMLEILDSSHEVQRVEYAISSALNSFDLPDSVLEKYGRKYRLHKSEELDVKGKGVISELRSMRNYPQHYQIGHLLEILGDKSVPNDVRLVLCESLGWYNYSYAKERLIAGLTEIRENADECALDDALTEELDKTIKRLKNAVR